MLVLLMLCCFIVLVCLQLYGADFSLGGGGFRVGKERGSVEDELGPCTAEMISVAVAGPTAVDL